MEDELRDHLGVFAGVSAVGLLAGIVAFWQVYRSASQMSYDTFSLVTVVIPCAIMLVCAFVIVATAKRIGPRLYGAVVLVCLFCGLASVIATSIWVRDPAFVASLLANSDPDTNIVPAIDTILIVLRDAVLFFAAATVGGIAGAMVGSRMHAMTAAASGKPKRKRKRRF